MKALKGTGIATITPFDKSGKVDYKAFEKHLLHLVNGGVDYVVVLGTTGETATLSKQEKKEVFAFADSVIGTQSTLVAGIGGNNTMEVAKEMESFEVGSYKAILSVSPYYSKPTQEGIYRHYTILNDVSPLPIIVYNVPGRTASNITEETTLRMARDLDNIVAIKEASGNMEQIMKLIKDRPEGFLVISGDDLLTFPIIAAGGDGVISVVGNAYPKEFSKMVNLSLSGNVKEAAFFHELLFDVTQLLFREGNPGGVKALLEIINGMVPEMRPPLAPISKGLYHVLEMEHKKIVGTKKPI